MSEKLNLYLYFLICNRNCLFMKYFSLSIVCALFVTFSYCQTKSVSPDIQSVFLNPPKEARPLCYWFWMGSNFSKSGITKDFEAMKDMGMGGGIVTNLTSSVEESQLPTLNLPWPKQTYRSPAYWDALRFSASEAKRLGLETGIHNAVGYSTTGGPWIDEEKGMQKLIWSKINVDGGQSINQKIAVPELPLYKGWGTTPKDLRASIYKDVAVLAVPDTNNLTIKSILDISKNMDKDGNLNWDCPAGKWIVYRMCYAPTMSKPHPVPEELFGKILEVNKMDKESNEFHWHNVIDPIKKNLGEYFGQSFNIMHVDSYESGNQNWTATFKSEFIAMKGYDPTPWLASMGTYITDNSKSKHRVINSEAETKKFEWDYRDVVNKLYFKNGWEVAKKMINNANLQFSWEPYSGPWSVSQGAALADFPMGEFWVSNKIKTVNAQIPAAARAAGNNIIGAEAFTCRPELSKWTETPASLKFFADFAFAAGINRFVLHQWVHQPFDDKYQPGMDMGWWGTHFSRHQTWFEPGKAFIKYLTRTSSLLQYGEQVVDVLYYEDLKNTNGDLISQEDFLKGKITVNNGNIVLPSGRTYKYLVFPSRTEMLPEVATKIKELVASGATIVAPKPIESPSLQNAPACNDALKQIADEVWGNKPINKYGKGIIVTDLKAEGANNIANINLPKDVEINDTAISAATRILHRRSKDTDLYFLVNSSQKEQHYTASFNITGKQPEFWQAEDGSTTDATLWYERDGRTYVSIHLKREQSVFVVFRKKANTANHPASVSVTDTLNNWSVINLNGKPAYCSSTSGKAEVVYSSGKKKTITTVAKSPMELNTDWNVSFAPKLDSVFLLPFPTLSDLSLNENDHVKYFSGTATYTKNLKLDNAFIQANQRIKLDLGVMNNQLADVTINGKKLGVLWYAPYVIDVTDYLQLGNNEIKIAVTNTWANRIIADEKEPADFEWGGDRPGMGQPMKAYPDWFIKNKPRPSQGRKTFSIWHYYKKDSKLLPAGLVGPVVLKREDLIQL